MASVFSGKSINMKTTLSKMTKADESHLTREKDKIKKEVEKLSASANSHMTGLAKEADTALVALKKLCLEASSKQGRTADQSAKLVKAQRDEIILIRKAAQQSIANFTLLCGDLDQDFCKTGLKSRKDYAAHKKDIAGFLTSIKKIEEKSEETIKKMGVQAARISIADAESSALIKQLMSNLKAYNQDAATYDKKIAALSNKIGVTMEQFVKLCHRMAAAKDKKEFMSVVDVAVKVIPTMKTAVDTLITLGKNHPNPQASKPNPKDIIAKTEKAIIEANDTGLAVARMWAKANRDPKDIQVFMSGYKQVQLKRVIDSFK